MDFLVPFAYIYFTLHKLLLKYNVMTLLKAFVRGMNLIYSLPVLSYIFITRSFTSVNIYGLAGESNLIFSSNQFGWAGCMFILTTIDVIMNVRPSRWKLIYLVTLAIIDLYIVLITGNRSSWLALLLATVIFIFRFRRMRTDFKILLLLLPAFFIIELIADPESSLNVRWNTTSSQLEKGEARLDYAQQGFQYLNNNKIRWITGAGMFNTNEVIEADVADYHNSYLEVLFGGGIVLLILFLVFILIRPLYNYLKYYSKYFLLLPPILIIPFFESNLTGGQFLFYPWFIFMLLFNITPAKAGKTKSMQQKSRRVAV